MTIAPTFPAPTRVRLAARGSAPPITSPLTSSGPFRPWSSVTASRTSPTVGAISSPPSPRLASARSHPSSAATEEAARRRLRSGQHSDDLERHGVRSRAVGTAGGDWTAELVWTSANLGNTYAVPVRHGDHLYGFNRRFLSCVELASGKTVWKSRQPGGHALTLAGDTLWIVSPDGELVVASASPEGYRERGRVDTFAARRVWSLGRTSPDQGASASTVGQRLARRCCGSSSEHGARERRQRPLR